MFKFIREKTINRMLQYGFQASKTQIMRVMVRLLYQVKHNIIFVIPGFRGHVYNDPCIEPLTNKRIRQAAAEGALNEAEVSLLSGFLAEGSQGVCAIINGKLAGYGLVQYEGEYRFGPTGRMIIPPKYAVAKNLFVLSGFRGQRLAQRLNEARLALIPAGHIPVGFIIPENRFAIRNWEMFGFQRILLVKRWCWFAGRWQMKIDRLADGKHVDELEQALMDGHCDKLYHS